MDTIESHDHQEFVGDAVNHGVAVEDDPHRAAIDDNPEKPARLTAATILAVFVCIISSLIPSSQADLYCSSWACHQSHPFQVGSSLQLLSFSRSAQL